MSNSDERVRSALEDEKPPHGAAPNTNFRDAMDQAGARPAESEPAPGPRHYLPMALAAGLLIVIGAATYMRLSVQGPRVSEDLTRGGVAQTDLEPAAGAELAGPPTQFRWPAHPDATRYVVFLRDGAGTLIWRSSPVTANSASLPPALAYQITARRAYLWSVEVTGLAGVKQLGPWSFRLR
jgi:hypothetical protein